MDNKDRKVRLFDNGVWMFEDYFDHKELGAPPKCSTHKKEDLIFVFQDDIGWVCMKCSLSKGVQ